MRPDFRRLLVTAVILLLAGVACVHDARAEGLDSLPNNFPHLNPSGFSATFSTQGFVDLTTEYSQPQGSNGRSCQTCHIPQQAWSINPNAIQLLFVLTGGTHPIFNPLDANNPNAGNFSTVEGRRAAYSMMLSRGVFRRGGALRTPREWNLIAAEDPNAILSDDQLVEMLKSVGFDIARRTVAKYREAIGLGSSVQRRRQKAIGRAA